MRAGEFWPQGGSAVGRWIGGHRTANIGDLWEEDSCDLIGWGWSTQSCLGVQSKDLRGVSTVKGVKGLRCFPLHSLSK